MKKIIELSTLPQATCLFCPPPPHRVPPPALTISSIYTRIFLASFYYYVTFLPYLVEKHFPFP